MHLYKMVACLTTMVAFKRSPSCATVVLCPSAVTTRLPQFTGRRRAEHLRHGLALAHRPPWRALHHAVLASLPVDYCALRQARPHHADGTSG